MAVVLLNTSEAAAALKVNERTVQRWVNAGRMQPVRRIGGGGGACVFTAEEVARVSALPRPKRGGRRPRKAKPPPQSETLPEVC